jgi:hypothetical protein
LDSNRALRLYTYLNTECGAFQSRENVQQLVDIGLIVVDGWRDAHEMLINLYVNLCLLQLSGDPLRVSYNKADNFASIGVTDGKPSRGNSFCRRSEGLRVGLNIRYA